MVLKSGIENDDFIICLFICLSVRLPIHPPINVHLSGRRLAGILNKTTNNTHKPCGLQKRLSSLFFFPPPPSFHEMPFLPPTWERPEKSPRKYTEMHKSTYAITHKSHSGVKLFQVIRKGKKKTKSGSIESCGLLLVSPLFPHFHRPRHFLLHYFLDNNWIGYYNVCGCEKARARA